MAPQPDAAYYILKRIIPALSRVFSLIGVDVERWYKHEMKRSRRPPLDRALPVVSGPRPGTIVGYFESNHCILCDNQCTELLCTGCSSDRTTALVALSTRRHLLEQRVDQLVRHCMSCSGVRDQPVDCRNLDCPHLFTRLKLERQHTAATAHLHLALPVLSSADDAQERESVDVAALSW